VLRRRSQHESLCVGADCHDAARVIYRLDRAKEVRVWKVVHIDAVDHDDDDFISAESDSDDGLGDLDFFDLSHLKVVPDHHPRVHVALVPLASHEGDDLAAEE